MERVDVGRRGVAPDGTPGAGSQEAGILSPWGYLLVTIWAVLAATWLKGWGLAGLVGMELAFGLAWSRRALAPLRRPRFWLLSLVCIALGPFLIGERDVALGPVHVSQAGWLAGLEMGGRALALTLGVSLGVGSLSLSDVVAVFAHLGQRGLGFATALAVNLTRTLQDMAAVTWQTIRLRGGARRPLIALRLFLITTVANTLRYVDDVVCAAEARAFDPTGEHRVALPLRRADLGLFLLLAVCTGLLVVLR